MNNILGKRKIPIVSYASMTKVDKQELIGWLAGWLVWQFA